MSDDIRRLSEELARDPASPVFLPLAESLRRAGDSTLALRVAERGLARHPYMPDAHDLLARIWADRGELEKATDEWEMTLRLEPAHRSARKGLGFVAFRRGALEDAERHLREAAASDGEGDESVTAALAHVRLALASVAAPVAPAAAVASAAPAATATEVSSPLGARALFAPVLEGADQTALLLDEDGLVLAGAYVDASGCDVSEEIGAELAGVRGEADRAMRHLDLGEWTSLVVEAEVAVVAMSPAPRNGLLLVAASRETPIGLLAFVLERALERARVWLGRAP